MEVQIPLSKAKSEMGSSKPSIPKLYEDDVPEQRKVRRFATTHEEICGLPDFQFSISQ